MRILGIGAGCDLGAMYLQLAASGHEVRVYNSELEEHGVMRGLVTQVADWQHELSWVRTAGRDGLILFETALHGALQDDLRRDGFAVIGGSALGDRLENDRELGQATLAAAGMSTLPARTFRDFDEAIAFIRARPRRYVFKLDGSFTSSWRNYVGRAADGSDVIALLHEQAARLSHIDHEDGSFLLMDHVSGLETGVGAYFDGERFLEPACLDWEHKHFFPGDLGELTGEMGTVVTYEHSTTLFARTLGRLAPVLREGGYVGYINLNTIIDEHGVIWPLELTCRFGYPGFAILSALHVDGWDALFRTLLERRTPRFATRPGFAVGVVLTVPPFPYAFGYAHVSKGLPISFDPSLSAEDRAHLHYAEVALHEGQLVASGATGYLMVATGVGETVRGAQRAAYARAGKVYVPNVRYRHDIGDALATGGIETLRALGYWDDDAVPREPAKSSRR